MARIRPFLGSAQPRSAEELSMDLVNLWMGNLRSIPYGFTSEWKTPEETESGAPADCKAKAVDLYDRMQAHGAKNLRLVVGKRTPRSRMSHAWLEWDTPNGNYVLDPTFNWRACRIEDFRRDNYVPRFAFEGDKKFRITQPALVAQN
jgi:predicted transglutaminase-like cysteine proteinase